MMVGATLQQQQQGTSVAPSAEDEALKRNTDCVYFLTSPLACKKGAECEYRHSEYARVNPRDCYFWLNGNCLNPKCGFRHPPLDGLFDPETEAPVGSFLPPMGMAAVSAIYAPQNPVKAPVQCIYFQRGFCSRGDKCGFLHGPNPTVSKSSQPIVASPSTELPPSKPQTSHQKFSQEVKTQQTNFAKAVEAPVQIKPAPKPETGSRKNGIDRNLPVLPSKILHDKVPVYKATNLPLTVNGNPSLHNRMHQSQVLDDHGVLNGKATDEFFRESSPGFDVLVDDELRNSDYYHGEEQYGRTRGPEGRNVNPIDEYDIDRSIDYNSVGDMDRESYHDSRGYENIQGQYGWDQHRSSSERVLLGQPHLESRGYSRGNDDVDLRSRLSKHKRGNGLRSVVSYDFASDKNIDDRVYRGGSPPRESSISGRLRGRIKLPRSPNRSDLHAERERDRIRSRGRLSPARPSRLGDRIKGRVEEDYDSEGRNPRGGRITRREMMIDDTNIRFSGPKSLAELKGSTTSSEGRKRKQREDNNNNNNQPSEGDLSFKGPMPLSEILKRKRGPTNEQHDNNQKDVKENLPQSGLREADEKAGNNDDESKSAVVENEVGDENESRIMGDEGDDDQREGGEYEYEQVDEGEYYEEGENEEAEEEDGDDDEDFAKKIGVIFS